MAISGFTMQFNQANQARQLQQQVRQQLGIPTQPQQQQRPAPNTDPVKAALARLSPEDRAAMSPTEFREFQQKAILDAQVADQMAAQQVFREIGLEQRAFQAGSDNVAPPRPNHIGFNNSLQMKHFLNSMMQLMMGFMQLGNGFSHFLGGGPVYPAQPGPVRPTQPGPRPFSEMPNAGRFGV